MFFRRIVSVIFLFEILSFSNVVAAYSCKSDLRELGVEAGKQELQSILLRRTETLPEGVLRSEDGTDLPFRIAFERVFADQIYIGIRQKGFRLLEELGKLWKKAVRDEIGLRVTQGKKRGEPYYAAHSHQAEEFPTQLARAHPEDARAVLEQIAATRRKPITDIFYSAFGFKNRKGMESLYKAFELDSEGFVSLFESKAEELKQAIAELSDNPEALKLKLAELLEGFTSDVEFQISKDFSGLGDTKLASIKSQITWPVGTREAALIERLVGLSTDQKLLNQSFKAHRMGDRDFDERLLSHLIEAQVREFQGQIMSENSELKDRVFSNLADPHQGADWVYLEGEMRNLLIQLNRSLEEVFPLTLTNQRLAIDEMPAQFETKDLRLQEQDGLYILNMPQVGMAEYDLRTGNVLLTASEARFSVRGPILALGHGEGTNQSNVASWQTVIKRFYGFGFYPVALSLPMSGPMPTITLEAKGLVNSAAFIAETAASLRQSNGDDVVGYVGRSAGSTKGWVQGLLYDGIFGAPNSVDFYILQSFSNPRTLPAQLKNIDFQIANGIIKEKVPEALDNFADVAAHGHSVAGELSLRERFSYGYDMFFLQGNADEDGGPNVANDLTAFRDDYAPLAPIMIFESPFVDREKYPFMFNAAGERDYHNGLPLEFEEATHFLDTERTNMTLKQWSRMFPTHPIDPKDLPARADQTDQVAAVRYAAMDYLERWCPMIEILPAAKAKAERLRAFRIKQIGDEVGENGTWLEWFRKKGLSRPISDEEYESAEALKRGGSLASRIKSVEQWLRVDEPARIRRLLEENASALDFGPGATSQSK